jgi:uncharacterized membrane protein
MGDAFDFSGMLDFLKKNLGNLLIVWLMSIVFGILAMFGILALGVGLLFTVFWSMLARFYLYGQVIRDGEKNSGAVTAAN